MVNSTTLLNLNNYTACYFKNGAIDSNSPYVKKAPQATVNAFAKLTGDPKKIDHALEWALFAYYGDIQVADEGQRATAENLLPHKNRRLASLRLGAALVQEISVLNMTTDQAQIDRYARMLDSICKHNKLTRAEIAQFYKQGKPVTETTPTAAVAAPVIAKQSTQPLQHVSFFLEDIQYDVTMSHFTDGSYELKYKKKPDFTYAIVSGSISAVSLKEFLAIVQTTRDFTKKSIAQITQQIEVLSSK